MSSTVYATWKKKASKALACGPCSRIQRRSDCVCLALVTCAVTCSCRSSNKRIGAGSSDTGAPSTISVTLPSAPMSAPPATIVGTAPSGANTSAPPHAARDPRGRVQPSELRPTVLPDRAVEVAVGRRDACARLEDGSVYCWGTNTYGRCTGRVVDTDAAGHGDTLPHCEPSRVQGLPKAHQIDSYCAVAGRNRELWCWLDQGAKPVADLVGSVRSTSRDCAVMRDATVWCLGYGPPKQVLGAYPAAQVVMGGDHTCVLHTNGQVACSGKASPAALGRYPGIDEPKALTLVPRLDGIVQIAAGMGFTCGLLRTGRALCWGAGLECTNLPTGAEPRITGVLHGVTNIMPAYRTACGRRPDGSIVCLRRFHPTHLDGIHPCVELAEPALAGAKQLSFVLDWHGGCGVWPDGIVQCWGNVAL